MLSVFFEAGGCLLLPKAALPDRNLSFLFLSIWVQFFELDSFILIS